MPLGSMPPENPAGQSGTVDADTHTMGSAPAGTRTRSGRARYLIAAALLVTALFGGGFALFGQSGEQVSTQWPRPYDPAKPFNMLGVPGVSVEQRERAEDLLLTSLQAAPLWADYHAVLEKGWYSVEVPLPGGYEHLVNPELIYDDTTLDPRRPEALVYKANGEKRTFVAYMFMAEPGTSLDDPSLLDFAGRLIEWHIHDEVCLVPEEGNRVGKVSPIGEVDGSCPTEGARTAIQDPRGGDSVPADSVIEFNSFVMTHVWVVARGCGPFSTLSGGARGRAAVPEDKRVDVC